MSDSVRPGTVVHLSPCCKPNAQQHITGTCQYSLIEGRMILPGPVWMGVGGSVAEGPSKLAVSLEREAEPSGWAAAPPERAPGGEWGCGVLGSTPRVSFLHGRGRHPRFLSTDVRLPWCLLEACLVFL